MERNYMEYIRKFLSETSIMEPVPTLLKPLFRSDPDVKACVFDVYGTILISASGDIDESVISADNLRMALDASGIELTGTSDSHRHVLAEMLDAFKNSVVIFHQTESTRERPYPEIDILQIWDQIIREYSSRNMLKLNGDLCVKCFTFVFEVLSNRIYPMPGMIEVIDHLARKAVPLGIISNAQFYTPVILNFFINGAISEQEHVPPFDADLTVFSYQHRRSKPDIYLFELLKTRCREKFGMEAGEILFIGNDMFRDVYPACQAGFKTVLFAGDQKSLRLREDKPELKGIKPDYIITDLGQLLKIFV